MELQIKSVKIDKKGIPEIGYVEMREDNKNPHIFHEGTGVAHDDFINAVSELAAHYALISGYAGMSKGLRLDTLKTAVSGFKPSGYSIGGKEGNEGITITGHVIVSWSGKACIVNSPFTLFEEGDESKYKFIDNLVETVEKIADEARQYIVDRKFKPEAQQELPFGEDQEKHQEVEMDKAETEDLAANSGMQVGEGGELQQTEETE